MEFSLLLALIVPKSSIVLNFSYIFSHLISENTIFELTSLV